MATNDDTRVLPRPDFSGTLRDIAKPVYNNTIRPYLPRKYGVYAGVPAPDAKLFDFGDRMDDYKAGFINAIHAHVDDGDDVTLVGGGRGVSTVHCCRAGAEHVTVIEAADTMLPVVEETVAIESPDADVDVQQALVGEAIDVYGDASEATVLRPTDLPTADVLVMDCEGAERSILEGLNDRYETVIVETHPDLGAPTDALAGRLDELGYDIETKPYTPGHQGGKEVLIGSEN